LVRTGCLGLDSDPALIKDSLSTFFLCVKAIGKLFFQNFWVMNILFSSVAEPHHFYAPPAPGKNFDAAPAPAPTLLYSKAKFLK
jgi:hypothetical protein